MLAYVFMKVFVFVMKIMDSNANSTSTAFDNAALSLA